MTYQERVTHFQTPRTDYWETLLTHAPVIIAQLNISTRTKLSQELGLSQPQMTPVVKLLQAYINLSIKVA